MISNAGFTSAIDPTVPVFGTPTTASVRDNFASAKSEIEGLAAQLAALGDLAQVNAPLPIALGGTGQTAAADALVALGGAPLASPALTGIPTAPTAAAATNTTQLATTAYVKAQNYLTAPISLTTQVSGILPVAGGGTGLAAGTSGGVPYFSAAGTMASSAALGVGLLLQGGGPGGAPAANPSWSFVAGPELRGSAASGALANAGLAPVLRLAAADGGFAGLLIEGWGAGSGFLIGRASGGSGAAPAATPAGSGLLTLSGRGYDTAYSTADAVRIRLTAADTFSATARGAYISFFTTAGGTTTLTEQMRLNANGTLTLPQTVTGGNNAGPGAINVSGGYYIGGAAVTSANWTYTAGQNLIANFSATPAPGMVLSGLQIAGNTSNTAGLQVDGFAQNQLIAMRRADGTPAAPAAIAAAERLSAIYAYGYDGAAYPNTAAITFEARQPFTASVRGTGINLWGTPTGSTAITAMLSLGLTGGGAVLPNSVAGGDMGLGTVNVSGGYYLGGVAVSHPNWTFNTGGNQIGNFAGGAAPPGLTLSGLQIVGNPGGIPGLQLDAFANNSSLGLRRANGTPAAPTAIANGDRLAQLAVNGYTGSGYSGNVGLIDFVATQAWTATGNGIALEFRTTPNGAVGNAINMVLGGGGQGGLTLPSTVTGGDVGPGTINISGGYYLGGAAALTLSGGVRQLSATTMTGVLTLAADPTVALAAATKQYVDNVAGAAGGPFLPLAGGTMTGMLNMSFPNDGSATGPINIGGITTPSGVRGVSIQGPDNPTTVPGIGIIRFGGTSGMQLRMSTAGGTAAAPTAVTSGTILGDWFTLGWNGSAFGRGTILRHTASENWTATANGSNCQINVTQLGTTALNTFTFHSNGSFLNPSTVAGGNTGAGTINVSSGYYIGGVNIRTGVADASAAPAGQIGEVITISVGPISLTSNVAQAIASFALTAGDWDVLVGVTFQPSAAQVNGAAIQLSNTSGSMAGAPSGGFGVNAATASLSNITGWAAQRNNAAAPQTLYVNVNAVFASGTMQAWAFGWARRAR